MQALRISLYLLAFVLSNLVVLWYGRTGLLVTALLLIPFDFVMRCTFHEQWKGAELLLKLGTLVAVAGCISFLINVNTKSIAVASVGGFFIAQFVAGVFYQLCINRSYFIKVNGSDALGILADSIVFQILAFGSLDYFTTISQFALKIVGGLFWYWVIFVKLKLQDKW